MVLALIFVHSIFKMSSEMLSIIHALLEFRRTETFLRLIGTADKFKSEIIHSLPDSNEKRESASSMPLPCPLPLPNTGKNWMLDNWQMLPPRHQILTPFIARQLTDANVPHPLNVIPLSVHLEPASKSSVEFPTVMAPNVDPLFIATFRIASKAPPDKPITEWRIEKHPPPLVVPFVTCSDKLSSRKVLVEARSIVDSMIRTRLTSDTSFVLHEELAKNMLLP